MTVYILNNFLILFGAVKVDFGVCGTVFESLYVDVPEAMPHRKGKVLVDYLLTNCCPQVFKYPLIRFVLYTVFGLYSTGFLPEDMFFMKVLNGVSELNFNWFCSQNYKFA